MNGKNTSNRQLKKVIRQLLLQNDLGGALDELRQIPGRRAVNPLFTFFYDLNTDLRWHAITAMGIVVSDLAERDIESARVVMRRFIWNLNDESGGIGWGCPEAMGETMACNPKLSTEYSRILLSYIQPDGNYLEHEMLQRGVWWGIARLAHARPEFLAASGQLLIPYMESSDTDIRGLAALAAAPVQDDKIEPYLKNLTDDDATLTVYWNRKLLQYTVKKLARKALGL